MMGNMEPRVLHVSEAEVVRDIARVLEKVRQGSEVIVEHNHRPVAVIKPSKPTSRPISEVVAELKARGSSAVIDDDFARDIAAGIEARRQPWIPPSWE
jgi:antitoxin (DNA-binding transcriptional repressor) of toxin-antitoxin stability system